MAYSAEISRRNPTAFLFLLDQSGSMSDPMAGAGGRQKAEVAATILNRLLSQMVSACSKPEVRDYFEVGVIGYGASVGPALGGALGGRDLVPISMVAENPLRVEERHEKQVDDTGRVVELPAKFAVWFDPMADNGTPMCEALRRAQRLLEQWVGQHPTSYPPTVVNITDGEATDGEPLQTAQAIQDLATSDGNMLLYNIHVSSTPGREVFFPENEDGLPDQFAQLLFRMSTSLPDLQRQEALRKGYSVSEQSRGFVFGASAPALADMLQIGTKTPELR